MYGNSTLPPENWANLKPTFPPENGVAEPDLAAGKTRRGRSGPYRPESLRPPKLTSPPEKYSCTEADLTAGKHGAFEANLAAGKHGALEADRTAGEHGAFEVNLAGKHGTTKVAAVEDNAPEVEVQALPGHRSVFLEMRGDDPDYGMADFADGLEGKSLRPGASWPGSGSYGMRK